MEFTRYLGSLAVLLGTMVLILLSAHLLFRCAIRRQNKCKKPVPPALMD